jgi:hypothetical protein
MPPKKPAKKTVRRKHLPKAKHDGHKAVLLRFFPEQLGVLKVMLLSAKHHRVRVAAFIDRLLEDLGPPTRKRS